MDLSDTYNATNTQTVSDKAELITDANTGKSPAEQLPLQAAKLQLGRKPIDHSLSFRIIVVSGIVFAVAITVALILSIYLGPPQIGDTGAVATDAKQCSDLGLQILKDGGNAVDAAVTATLCLGVVNPQSSGLGGGGFMLVHDHKVDRSWAYDFREVAPDSLTAEMFGSDENLFYNSGLSVGVPGELKGLSVAHTAHGKLKWYDVVKPVADLARNGFNVTKALAHTLQTRVKVADMSPKMKSIFSLDGRAVKEGDFITRADLANVLDEISNDPDALYHGDLAEDFVKAARANKGVITVDDLVNYRVIERDLIKTPFQGGFVATVPPPSSGPLLLLMMNIMEGFNWTSKDIDKPETYHQMIETFKFAYAHHGDLGDPKFDKMRIDNATTVLISKDYANELRKKIDNETHLQDYYMANYKATPNGGTSHLSVVDASELTVSLTSTVNTWFGSKIMSEKGIVLNNEMADFSVPAFSSKSMFHLPDNPHNLIEPGKRPLSSMTPAIVYNKAEPCNRRIILGAANGTKIIAGVAEVIANVMLFNLNLTYSIQKPRVYNQLVPDVTEYEEGISDSVLQYLKDHGHTELEKQPEGISVVNAIMKQNDNIFAYSDERKGGKASIYFQTTKK